ncbi:MAG TPA: hypothetical protein VFI95_20745 [Terriglobales bacterium]|nr:hypothetical protein [Terriglobales bacterium]
MPATKSCGTDGQIYQGATKIGARNTITFSTTVAEADASDHDSGGFGETVTTTASATVDANGFLLVDSSSYAWDTLQKKPYG